MSNIIYTGGAISGGKHLWKILDNGTTLSTLSSHTLSGTINALAYSSATNRLYIAIESSVYCYTADILPVTSWGTNGSIDVGATVNGLAVNNNDYLAVAHGVADTNKRISLYSNTGTLIWRSTVFGTNTTGKDVSFDLAGNINACTLGGASGQYEAACLKLTDGSLQVGYTTKAASGANSYAISSSKTVSGICYYLTSYTSSILYCYNGSGNQVFSKGLAGSTVRDVYHLNGVSLVLVADSTTLRSWADSDGSNPQSVDTSISLTKLGSNSNNEIYCIGAVGNIKVYNSSLFLQRSASPSTASLNDIQVVPYATPTDKTYSKKLISIAGNQVWYESAVDTMSELTAANGAVECILPLEAIEAYQKLFIVNGTNKKVIDAVNTKINTADAGANPCTFGMTLTGGTSGAQMIVDYVDGVTDNAAANVYGYRTTTATFSSGETVTGTNSAGNAVSFVTSAAETAPTPPHWYNWTVFGNDTTNYGTMPSSSSLIALYRGRIVFNDDLRPQAWYMTKVGNPFKIKYDYANDGDLSGLSFANNLVGVLGDILTALIAYKDDLLIFGCANSIWLLVGDPLASGQLAQITDTTGIWGSRAWCIDDKRNLYFFGNDGVYRMPISETTSPPENISKTQLPELVKDWDLDKSLHRVKLSFDPVNYGILVTKTTLADGTCEGYWYDLTAKGWFPESYPPSCGIFSSYFYPAIDETYRKFLVGCNDGYIREFDWSTKNDATTSSTTAINSYLSIIKPLTNDDSKEGLLQSMNVVLAGGASSGAFADTDALSYALYKGNDAETVLEDIIDDTATAFAFQSGTWTGTGEKDRIRPRMKGTYMGLKLYNSTASQTFAIEKLFCDIYERGEK